MPLTEAHLRYLLAIYEVSQTHLDISSRSIAEKLGVTKPSVVRIMNLLMERGMIVKEHYGKIYMTDRGIFVAKEVRAQLERVLQNFPPDVYKRQGDGVARDGQHFPYPLSVQAQQQGLGGVEGAVTAGHVGQEMCIRDRFSSGRMTWQPCRCA